MPDTAFKFMDQSGFDTTGKYFGPPTADTALAARTLPGAGAPAATPGSPAVTTPTAAPKDLSTIVADSRTLLGEQPQSEYQIPAMIEEQKRTNEIARKGISDSFDRQITDARQLGKNEMGSAGNDVSRFRGEGFSSAANAYMDSVQKKGEKRIADLEAAKAAALANLDVEAAGKIQALQLKEMDRQDKIAETRFNQLMQLVGVGLTVRGQDQSAQQFDKTFGLQQSQFDYQQKRDLLQDTKEAKQFAAENNITSAGYELAGTWYSTTTGQAFPDKESAAAAGLNESNVTHFDPTAKETKQFVQSLAAKYPDANIDFTKDTVSQAQAKIKNSSAIYRKETYIAPTKGTTVDPYEQAAKDRKFLKDTVAPGIIQLAQQGKSWGEIADQIVKQGFDPAEFDDVFHRTFSSPAEYDTWRKGQADIKKGNGTGGTQLIQNPDGSTTITLN